MHIFSSRVFNNLQGSLKNKSEKKRRRGPTLEALDVLGSWRRATEVLQHLNLTPSTRSDVVTLSSVASWDFKSEFRVPKIGRILYQGNPAVLGDVVSLYP